MTGTLEHGEEDGQEEIRVQARIFAFLLKGHSASHSRGAPGARPASERLRRLLEDFGEVSRRVTASDSARFIEHREVFRRLLIGHAEAMERYRWRQEYRADDFNLLDVLQIAYREIRHSMVLAWLLDHDIRHYGTHAQGPLGFRLFLGEVGLPEAYANYRYRVQREMSGDDSIVDVEVACKGRFLIHIENKIRSAEGVEQTKKPSQVVSRCSRRYHSRAQASCTTAR